MDKSIVSATRQRKASLLSRAPIYFEYDKTIGAVRAEISTAESPRR